MSAFPVCRAGAATAAGSSHGPRAGGRGDEDLLATMYVRMWSLATGRSLPAGARPDQLTVEELISFWADDFPHASGRHAVPGAGLAGEAR